MYRKPLYLALILLALATLACRITVDLPFNQIKTGPTQTMDINIPLLKETGAVADVELAFGAGRLNISPGAIDQLITGTATYNVPEFKPQITTEGTSVRISQDESRFEGIPTFGDDVKNTWDLELGDAPMNLRVAAGAYQGRIELGGLSLENLRVSDGAAESQVSFSEPNQVQMDTLRYETGASKITLTGLANANFGDMIFKGGAGDYRLDFSGDLQRDATVNVQSGLSNVVISVPEGTAARLTIQGGLANVDRRGSWEKSADTYLLSGEGPMITFTVDMGAGNLELNN
ncbi:MAG TPA: toast rack family protein [Anaerolineales bacterium]|jgi:hypothetical protein|nr:toast rack family protein [Anaerolineales bacterium]